MAELRAQEGGGVEAGPEALPLRGLRPLRYSNRELSWLAFDERVLALAEDRALPLLERVRYLAISARNLDEFFAVRVAGLKEQLIAGLTEPAPDGLTPAEQLAEIRTTVENLVRRQSMLFGEELLPELLAAGIQLASAPELDDADRTHLDSFFRDAILPILTPLAVDGAHPFPFVTSLALNLAVVLRGSRRRERPLALVKLPPVLPRLIRLPGGDRFAFLEDVVGAHLGELFPGMEIVSHLPFRVTRNADIGAVDEEAEDLVAEIETELRRRRTSRVVRLEVDGGIPAGALSLLLAELEIGEADTFVHAPLDLAALGALCEIDRPDLKYPRWRPLTQPRLRARGGREPDLFEVLRRGPVLLHHPYDSFSTSVEAFIEQAADDRDVLAIKQTLYRTSWPSNPVVEALIRAAEAGKQVVALVELKARFDERANIAWAKALEEAGVHVVYGVLGLKTHAKVVLVVRREGEALRSYVHIGTGNYNAQTAGAYEDLGLLSAEPELVQDVAQLFNSLTGYSRAEDYRRLLVAPTTLRPALLKRIAEQSHPSGRIVMKMNNLVDPELIDALYRASQAGAEVDLVVRGICCLKPGVPRLSERIRVRSLVGRYLAHSRVFVFGRGARAEYLVGSSDLMPRNLDRRVEAVFPVVAPDLRRTLAEIVEVWLSDGVRAWTLGRGELWRSPDPSSEDVYSRLREAALALSGQPAPRDARA